MTVVDAQAGADLIARTRALIPLLRSRAEETAAARRVPIENIRLLQRRLERLEAKDSTKKAD